MQTDRGPGRSPGFVAAWRAAFRDVRRWRRDGRFAVVPQLFGARDLIGDSPPNRALRHANLPAFPAFSGHARPITSSGFDAHHRKGALFHIGKNRTGDDIRPRFLPHPVPAGKGALSGDRGRFGFASPALSFDARGTLSDGRRAAVRALPDHGLAAIRTGRFPPDGSRTREATHRFTGD